VKTDRRIKHMSLNSSGNKSIIAALKEELKLEGSRKCDSKGVYL
jgi:hypothetical protein